MTMTTRKRAGGLTPLAKGLITTSLAVAGVFATKHFAPGLFGGTQLNTPATVPPRAELPVTQARVPGPAPAGASPSSLTPASAASSPVPSISPPSSSEPGCRNLPEVRMLIWAWNAQQGLLFANGGPQAVADSLMCKRGVNLIVQRQDMVDQMQAELIECASRARQGQGRLRERRALRRDHG